MISADPMSRVSDYSSFAKDLGTSKVIVVIVYINNFPYFGLDIQEINIVKTYMADWYKMKDRGP